MKYRNYYTIENIHSDKALYNSAFYELSCRDGIIGTFTTCKAAKCFVDREVAEGDKRWNDAVMEFNKEY